MTSTSMHLGPRGWAVLTLLGGAALASPFMRSKSTPQAVADKNNFPTFGTQDIGAQGTQAVSSSVASSLTPHGNSSFDSRFVSGALPTTKVGESKPTELPAWVRERSPLDELIDGTQSPTPDTNWREIGSNEPQAPVDLRPWREKSLAGSAPNSWNSPNQFDALASGNRLHSTVDADPFAPTAPPMVALGRHEVPTNQWPDQQLLPALSEIARSEQRPPAPRTFGESSPGNLVGTALRRQLATDSQLNSTSSNQLSSNPLANGERADSQRTEKLPTSRKFVFQPGFQGSHANKP